MQKSYPLSQSVDGQEEVSVGPFPHRFGGMDGGFWGTSGGDARKGSPSSKMAVVVAEPSGVLRLLLGQAPGGHPACCLSGNPHQFPRNQYHHCSHLHGGVHKLRERGYLSLAPQGPTEPSDLLHGAAALLSNPQRTCVFLNFILDH